MSDIINAQLSQLEEDSNTTMERRFDHLKDRLEEFTTVVDYDNNHESVQTKSKRGSTATMTMINDADNIGYDYETTNNERSRNTCTDCVLRTLEELILILTSLERRDEYN